VVSSWMVPRSMSSRDMRFSEAVKVPWESGDGRASREDVADAEEVDVEAVGMEGVRPVGRADVVVDVDEPELVVRCVRRGLGPGEDVGEGDAAAGEGVFLAEPEDDEPEGTRGIVGDVAEAGPLWPPLLLLWLLFVRWRLEDELTDDDEPEASGRA
jgi:hypothetical protein